MSTSIMTFGAERILFAGAAVLCAAIASIYDVRERRIPNRLTASALLGGLLLHLLFGGWRALGMATLAGLVAGSLFLIFYFAGGTGAGDVKLMAAVACITGFASLQMVLLATVLTGGLFAVLLAAHRGRLRQTFLNILELLAHHGREGLAPHPDLNVSNEETLRLPYALPIAAGCLAWLCVLAWGHPG